MRVATHQKTQQGLKPLCGLSAGRAPQVATHQKTQQGLKHQDVIESEPERCRNASENPTGIETLHNRYYVADIVYVATHQKTQQGLKQPKEVGIKRLSGGRNASENPTGIETLFTRPQSSLEILVATHQKTQQGLKPLLSIWVEDGSRRVATHQKTQQGLKRLTIASALARATSQRIRKPNRD